MAQPKTRIDLISILVLANFIVWLNIKQELHGFEFPPILVLYGYEILTFDRICLELIYNSQLNVVFEN